MFIYNLFFKKLLTSTIWFLVGLFLVFMGLLFFADAGELSTTQLQILGKQIYLSPGSNTCLKCHGFNGYGGDQAGAADLRKPTTWKTYKEFSGDHEKIKLRLLYLIENGSIRTNIQKDPRKSYNIMMKGLTSFSMKKAVRKIEKEYHLSFSKSKLLASRAVLQYVISLDEENIFQE